jgi:hypothetical protein
MITIQLAPYGWSAVGQKLVVQAISNQLAQQNFKYGIRVVQGSNSKEYTFLYDPNPLDGKLYFDVQPLIQLRNMETALENTNNGTIVHYTPPEDVEVETIGYGYDGYQVFLTEWWNVSGVLTENEGSEQVAAFFAFNAELQQWMGYRPNPESGIEEVKFKCGTLVDYMWSDRWVGTSKWDMAATFGLDSFFGQKPVYIAAHNDDYGCIGLQAGKAVMALNDTSKMRFILYYGDVGSVTSVFYDVPIGDYPFAHIGCYPQNMDSTSYAGAWYLSSHPDWIAYMVVGTNTIGTTVTTKPYVFYNADRFGKKDCRHNPIRLAWKSTRAGWDYWTFTKKSEFTNNIQRKQYVRLIENGTSSIFEANQRQYIDRTTINSRTIVINSDWIQENEYIFLRNLFTSKQVEMLWTPQKYNEVSATKATTLPVSIEDTTFTERRDRNGKLYNVTIRLKVSQDYWT